MADEGEDRAEMARIIGEKTHPWQGWWRWGTGPEDKAIAERHAVRTVLSSAGLPFEDLHSNPDDPPDCMALVEGVSSGIEVTELLHEKTLARSMRAVKQRAKGNEPKKPEAFFVWDQETLIAKVQECISAKDEPHRVGGGPFERYILVIVADEMYLDRTSVAGFLAGAEFHARRITDALLGLSYHPSTEAGGGSYPVFPLTIRR
jgi:hypothetical protein